MLYKPEFLAPHLASIVASVLLLIAALRAPRFGRVLVVVLFLWASLVNWFTVVETPRAYLEYAPLAISKAYREIILGPFAEHIRLFVGSIAACQGLIAAGVTLGGIWGRAALLGAVVFLIDIAPLGIGSGFPSTVIMALAAAVLLSPSRRPALAPPLWIVVQAALKSRLLREDP